MTAADLEGLTPIQLRERVKALGRCRGEVLADLATNPSYGLALEEQRVRTRRAEALEALRKTMTIVSPPAAAGQLLDIAA